MEKLKVRLTFFEEILGTASSDPEVHAEYIASKAPDAPSREEEVAALGTEAVINKAKTIFPRNENGQPIFWDYQIKGFFKDACSFLSRVGGKDENGKKNKAVNESSKITAFKKVIDGLIFPAPRQIVINYEGALGSCQRPIRIHGPQGERVSLANSETIPVGAYIEFEIECFSEQHIPAVKEWLDYGKYFGLGQWRSSGKGRFTWEEIK